MRRLFPPLPNWLLVLSGLLVIAGAGAGGLLLWRAVGDVPFIKLAGDPSEPRTSPALAEGLPPGFTVAVLADGFEAPTAVVPAPDGKLFVAEQGGRVWVIENEVRRAKPFIDLSEEVNSGFERGLLGLAVDPNFKENGWVYLAFTVDPVFGEPDEAAETVTYSRVVRYRATEESGRTEADPDSRQVLIGNSPKDGIPVAYNTHTVGDLAFAADGTLFISAGDGARGTGVDYGPDPVFESMFGPEQDIGALRAQSLTSLTGKILRIDPSTGEGLPSNPFFTGDPKDNASKVWALGFRNPYRITVSTEGDGNDVLYVGDPGQNWEEIDAIRAGDNAGWPCYEGPDIREDYSSIPEVRQQCEALHQEDTVPPTFAYDESRHVVIGGFLYRAPSQQEWDGRYFYADYLQGFIRAFRIGEDGQAVDERLFAQGLDGPVDLAQGDCGEIYVVEIIPGRLLKIAPPTATC